MSKIIPKIALEDVKRWNFDEMSAERHAYHEGPGAMGKAYPTLRDIETIKKQLYEQSYEEGYNEGYADGLKMANEEFSTSIKVAAGIIMHLKNPLKEMDQDVKKALAELAVLIAQQVIRREVNYRPDEIIPVIEEAVRILSVGIETVHIYLNPNDAEHVRKCVNESKGESGQQNQWHIIESEDIERGGCRVCTESSSVDSTIENKIGQIADSFLRLLENI